MSKIKIPVRVNDNMIVSYLVFFGKISKRSAIVPRSYAQREPCVINEIENESGPDLEIGKFSDHDPDLFFDQQKISDRLVYNMYKFVAKNFFSPARAWQNAKSAIMENPPRPKI